MTRHDLTTERYDEEAGAPRAKAGCTSNGGVLVQPPGLTGKVACFENAIVDLLQACFAGTSCVCQIHFCPSEGEVSRSAANGGLVCLS